MTKPTPLQAAIAKTIESFEFDDYGLDDISIGIQEAPDEQDWIPDLAREIAETVASVTTVKVRKSPSETPKMPTETRLLKFADELETIAAWMRSTDVATALRDVLADPAAPTPTREES